MFTFVVLLTWALWSFGFSLAFNQLTELVGFPEKPAVFWSMLLSLSFFMGFIPSVLLYKVTGASKVYLSLVFVLLIGLLSITGAFSFGGYSAVTGVLKSNGFWVFLVGAYTGALISRKELLPT